MKLHPAIQAVLTQEAWQVLRGLGVESDSDLSFLFAHERDIFDTVSDPPVLQSLTHAWQIARFGANVLLQQQPHKVRKLGSDCALVLCAQSGV